MLKIMAIHNDKKAVPLAEFSALVEYNNAGQEDFVKNFLLKDVRNVGIV